MKKLCRRSVLLLGAVFCLLLNGCGMLDSIFGGGAKPPEGGFAPPEHSMQAEAAPEKVMVDIYWDATYSMQGFTTLAAGNLYRTLPAHLGDIGNSMGGVKFYRFGADVKPLEGREHLRFSDPAYYDELITATHRTIDVADIDHLSIIITDLFESDADWSNVTQKLKEKFFSQHRSVAIIGIKSSFMGDIFDVGLNAAQYFYNSGDDPAKFRPFYMIVMGPDAKVREFMERWKDRQRGPNETQYLLLSEVLMDKQGDFSNLKQKAATNLFLDEKLGIKDKRIKEFGIDSFGEPASLTVDFRYQPAFGSCPVDMSKLQSLIEIFTAGEDGQWTSVERDGDITATVQESADQPGEYELMLRFTPDKCLAPEQINYLHVNIAPTAKGYTLPDWVKSWNMSNVDVSPEYFDGSKTVNLWHIADSLKDSSIASARPSLVHLDLVLMGK